MLLHLPANVSPLSKSCFYIGHLMLLYLPHQICPLSMPHFCICHLICLHFPPHDSPFATSCFCICYLMVKMCLSHNTWVSLPTYRGRKISYIFILHHAPPPIVIITPSVKHILLNFAYWHCHVTIISSRFQVIRQIIRALFLLLLETLKFIFGQCSNKLWDTILTCM